MTGLGRAFFFGWRGLLPIASRTAYPERAFVVPPACGGRLSSRDLVGGGSEAGTTRGRPTSAGSGGGWGGRRRLGSACRANIAATATIATLDTPLHRIRTAPTPT